MLPLQHNWFPALTSIHKGGSTHCSFPWTSTDINHLISLVGTFIGTRQPTYRLFVENLSTTCDFWLGLHIWFLTLNWFPFNVVAILHFTVLDSVTNWWSDCTFWFSLTKRLPSNWLASKFYLTLNWWMFISLKDPLQTFWQTNTELIWKTFKIRLELLLDML